MSNAVLINFHLRQYESGVRYEIERKTVERALYSVVERWLPKLVWSFSKYTPPGFRAPHGRNSERVFHAIFYKFSHKLRSRAVKSCFCWTSPPENNSGVWVLDNWINHNAVFDNEGFLFPFRTVNKKKYQLGDAKTRLVNTLLIRKIILLVYI